MSPSAGVPADLLPVLLHAIAWNVSAVAQTRASAKGPLARPSFPSLTAAQWEATIAAADAHRVLALLARAVEAAGEAVPAPVHAELVSRHRAQAARSLAAIGPLFQLLDALHDATIPVLLWKGPALSVECWGDAGARRFADLDLVVSPADFMKVRAVAGQLGWKARGGFTARQEGALARPRGAWELGRGSDEPVLELHRRFSDRRYPFELTADDVLGRAATLPLAGREVKVPSPADALVLLAFHGTKHGWSALDDLAVFAAMCARYPGTIAEAAETARSAGASPALDLALALVRQTMGIPETRHQVTPSAVPQAQAMAVRARWLNDDPAWRPTLAWDLAMTPGTLAKASLIWRSVTDLTAEDVRRWPLPDTLTPLYGVLRPLRLLLREVQGGASRTEGRQERRDRAGH